MDRLPTGAKPINTCGILWVSGERDEAPISSCEVVVDWVDGSGVRAKFGGDPESRDGG